MKMKAEMKQEPKKILFCDDHYISLIGLESVLREATSEDLTIQKTINGEQAIEVLRKNTPDLFIVDLGLPDISGLELIKYAKNQSNKIKIIVLTASNDSNLLKQLISFDIQALLQKDNSAENILEALKHIDQGASDTYFDEVMLRLMSAPSDKTLSVREQEVLQLMVQGYTSKEIAEKMRCSINTVKTYRVRILNKSGSRNSAEVTAWYLKNGL